MSNIPESPPSQAVRVSVNPKTITGGLTLVAVLLGAAHVIMHVLQRRLPEHPLYALPRFFDLGAEANLPTHFSALCLLFAGLLCLLTAPADAVRQKSGWFGLGLGFIYLSYDEAAQIHDGIINPVVTSIFGSFETSLFHYGWVAVALVAVGVVAVLYLGFLTRLPRGYAAWFIVAGTVYLGGAVGMEMLEAHFVATDNWPKGWFPWRMLAEEMGEMMGVILFLFILLRYMERIGVSWALSVGKPKA
ncbi:MAG: hypothetical protein KDK74_06510 [Cephaloticoccus sp.]|nr:hypothetical protein [Cephaloticoccus sp.]